MAYPGGNYQGGYSNYPGGQYGQQGGTAPGGYGVPGGQPGYGAQPGYGQPGGYPGAAPQGGGYGGGYQGGAPAGYQQPGAGQPQPNPANPAINPDVQKWFTMVDRDRSGKINAKELQGALINGKGQNFTDTACNLMIGMFDRDHSGTIDIYEFEKLYAYINQWLNMFKSYDRDQSGHIEEAELSQALSQMGFRFSPEFIKFLVKKSDPQTQKEISVDQFIVLCVQIQRFTEAFRMRDNEQRGVITINFEDFLSVAISCTT